MERPVWLLLLVLFAFAAWGRGQGRSEVEPSNSWHTAVNFMREPYIRRAEQGGGAEKERSGDELGTGEAELPDANGPRFHWHPALAQSMIFLGIQHGFRMLAPKTRDELGGPFFKDWMKSEKNMRGWEDGDSGFTNYVSHPLQGALTGRIFVNNSDAAKAQEFGPSKEYWNSRLKAMLWSTFWSTQYELGPISEASIGNVGLRDHNGHCTMAYVDLVITPTVGTAVLIGEDAIDRYLLKHGIEKDTTNKRTVAIMRTLLTPTTSTANVLRGKKPWKRDDRPL